MSRPLYAPHGSLRESHRRDGKANGTAKPDAEYPSHCPSTSVVGVEASEEVVEGLLPGVDVSGELLDAGLELLDLFLLVVELLEVLLVDRGAGRSGGDVGAQAFLVLGEDVELRLDLGLLALDLEVSLTQVHGPLQPLLDVLRGDRLADEPADAFVALVDNGEGLEDVLLLGDDQILLLSGGDLHLEAMEVTGRLARLL